jgi:hypothetical protein
VSAGAAYRPCGTIIPTSSPGTQRLTQSAPTPWSCTAMSMSTSGTPSTTRWSEIV